MQNGTVHLVFPLGFIAIGHYRHGPIYEIEDCNFLLSFTSPSLRILNTLTIT
jgi:hypothetical protein